MADAQAADSSSSLMGATMVHLQLGAWLRPGPNRSISAQGAFQRFVSEHWQVGFEPAFAGYTGPHGSSVGAAIAGVANYMIGAGRTRAYVGGYAGGSAGSQGDGATTIGAQVGALHFVAPATAIRAEFRTRRWDSFGSSPILDASMTLDSYIDRPGIGAPALPTAGVTDASLDATVAFNYRRERRLDVMVAPFLSSWAQIGGEYEGIAQPINGQWPMSHRINGFARLYAPLSPRIMPFVHGFAEATKSPFGSEGPMSFGLMGGVRHYFNRGAAFEAGLQWRHYHELQSAVVLYSGGSSDVSVHRPDELTIQARIVTELRARWMQ